MKNLPSLYTQVQLYCDGSCLGNPGPGGWGYILRTPTVDGFVEKEASGAEAVTTNNRMELMAVIEGLSHLLYPCDVSIYSDSQYVVKGIQCWLEAWKRKGWLKSDGKQVINLELWQALDAQLNIHKVVANWVRGHDGHVENERVDYLAKEAAKSIG
jgi:ribonuclease HI